MARLKPVLVFLLQSIVVGLAAAFIAVLLRPQLLPSLGRPEQALRPASYADAVTKLADDCGKDIQKLCKGLNLGGGRIADCLQQNADKVSPSCKASLATVFQSITQREHAQTAYRQVCQRDMSKSCSGIKGDGFVLACLVAQTRVESGIHSTLEVVSGAAVGALVTLVLFQAF